MESIRPVFFSWLSCESTLRLLIISQVDSSDLCVCVFLAGMTYIRDVFDPQTLGCSLNQPLQGHFLTTPKKRSRSQNCQVSNEKRAPGCLACIGDFTTQFYRDCNKRL